MNPTHALDYGPTAMRGEHRNNKQRRETPVRRRATTRPSPKPTKHRAASAALPAPQHYLPICLSPRPFAPCTTGPVSISCGPGGTVFSVAVTAAAPSSFSLPLHVVGPRSPPSSPRPLRRLLRLSTVPSSPPPLPCSALRLAPPPRPPSRELALPGSFRLRRVLHSQKPSYPFFLQNLSSCSASLPLTSFLVVLHAERHQASPTRDIHSPSCPSINPLPVASVPPMAHLRRRSSSLLTTHSVVRGRWPPWCLSSRFGEGRGVEQGAVRTLPHSSSRRFMG